MAVRRLESFITNDFSELNVCLGNRCGSFDAEIVEEMGWNEKNVHEFRLRVNRIKKSIIENGLLITERIVVGKLDGTKYIIDGQSRKVAIEELNAEKRKKGDNDLYVFEVAVFEFDTKAEMITYMRCMNECKKNWSSDNKTFAYIHSLNDGEEKTQLLESYEKAQEYSSVSGMCVSVTKDVMFGQGASKEENIKKCNIYAKNYWDYSPKFMNDMIALNRSVSNNKNFDGKQKKLCTCEKFANGFRTLHKRIEDKRIPQQERTKFHKMLTEKIADYLLNITQATATNELKFATIPQAASRLQAIAVKGMKKSSDFVEALS